MKDGIEIKVGQVWRCQDGTDRQVRKFYGGEGEGEVLLFLIGEYWYSREGVAHGAPVGTSLVELVKDVQIADAKDLAADMLSDLGWHFDGTTWVQDEQVGFTVEAPQVDATLKVEWESNVFAPTLLIAAAKHMADRAATYDKPDGERSMAQTVAIFKEFHGIEMTEAQGWHFMQILKDVRLFTRVTYHADSAEDCIAYAALKAEAKAQEGGAK